MTDISPTIQALVALRPGAQWVITGDDLSTLTWMDDSKTKPTDAEINTKVQDLIRNPVIANPLDTWDVIALKVSFNNENRIRALEGKSAITMAQYKTALKALL